jgi:hypothetical protein
LEWSPDGSTSWTQIGGTIAAGTLSYAHTGLTAGTNYYYRMTTVGDGVTYSNSGYATANATTTSGLVVVSFPTKSSGLTESPTGTWDSAVSANDYGVSNLVMAGDGTFQADVTSTGNAPLVLGNVNTLRYWLDGAYNFLEKVGLFVYSGNYYYVEGGTTNNSTSIAATIGDKYRIRRAGSAFIGEKSSDGGTTWTTLRSFTTTQSGTLYLKTSILNSGSKLVNPKGTGVA